MECVTSNQCGDFVAYCATFLSLCEYNDDNTELHVVLVIRLGHFLILD